MSEKWVSNKKHFSFFLIGIHSIQGWNSHNEAGSYKEKKHKKVKAYRKSV